MPTTQQNGARDARKRSPNPGDVADGIERYRENKQRAAELDEQIQRADDRIDEIVYELYGLTDEEIGTVEDAVAD